MKNIIKVNFSEPVYSSSVKIMHNDQILNLINGSDTQHFVVNCDSKQNSIAVISQSLITLNWITMFDIGKEKLVYLGVCKKQNYNYQSQIIEPQTVWQLEYCAPVFRWLHQTLQHGWLVSE